MVPGTLGLAAVVPGTSPQRTLPGSGGGALLPAPACRPLPRGQPTALSWLKPSWHSCCIPAVSKWPVLVTFLRGTWSGSCGLSAAGLPEPCSPSRTGGLGDRDVGTLEAEEQCGKVLGAGAGCPGGPGSRFPGPRVGGWSPPRCWVPWGRLWLSGGCLGSLTRERLRNPWKNGVKR